jgi:hypothetical protein
VREKQGRRENRGEGEGNSRGDDGLEKAGARARVLGSWAPSGP